MTSLIKLHMAIAGCLAQKYLHASQLAELGDRSITSFPFEIELERELEKVSGTFFWTLLAKFVSVDLDWRHRCGWIAVTNASASERGCCTRIRRAG